MKIAIFLSKLPRFSFPKKRSGFLHNHVTGEYLYAGRALTPDEANAAFKVIFEDPKASDYGKPSVKVVSDDYGVSAEIPTPVVQIPAEAPEASSVPSETVEESPDEDAPPAAPDGYDVVIPQEIQDEVPEEDAPNEPVSEPKPRAKRPYNRKIKL